MDSFLEKVTLRLERRDDVTEDRRDDKSRGLFLFPRDQWTSLTFFIRARRCHMLML